jgi:iron(III) transport system ATP-binding protein
LLDEPFSNLDVQVRLHLRQEVRDVLKQVNASGVFVTHDQEEALAIADQVAVMRQGQLEQWGSPESVYSAPISRFIASFVTQANFIPARRTPQGWETELGLVPQVLQADGATPDATLTQGDIMVRQEDLVLQSVDRGLLRVKSRQFLGREYKYGLSTPSGYTLYVRQPASQAIAVGEQVNPVLPHHPLRIYPPQS